MTVRTKAEHIETVLLRLRIQVVTASTLIKLRQRDNLLDQTSSRKRLILVPAIVLN